MARLRISGANGRIRQRSVFDFTVILMPVPEEASSSEPVSKRRKLHPRNALTSGYQVTVPLLPGIVTYGRTEKEALDMARDAIRCHLDGLRKSGEEIPDEKNTHTARLRVALSA
ncbi:MAG TPA: type II toxin-antitoxin system HicB family antitoxin [Candidatus Acidoferrales bacterium]|jgi:predicted RNase H-like HicB family nuclease|nr:type II toxin-antitoxin system HicB family antitoxin [Candidatus Acidoferrales bacterium]